MYTKENPADLTSRGATVDELTNNDLWWKGPEFLHQPVSQWPKVPYFDDKDDQEEEKKQDSRPDDYKKYLEQGCRVFILKIPVKKEAELFHSHIIETLKKTGKRRNAAIVGFIKLLTNCLRASGPLANREIKAWIKQLAIETGFEKP